MQFGQFSPHLNILQTFFSNSQFGVFSNKTQSSFTLVGNNGEHFQGLFQKFLGTSLGSRTHASRAVAKQDDARCETQNWHPPPFIKKLVFCFLFMGKSEWTPFSSVTFCRNENSYKNDAPVENDALCTYLDTDLHASNVKSHVGNK